jgi:hypothetical protein
LVDGNERSLLEYPQSSPATGYLRPPGKRSPWLRDGEGPDRDTRTRLPVGESIPPVSTNGLCKKTGSLAEWSKKETTSAEHPPARLILGNRRISGTDSEPICAGGNPPKEPGRPQQSTGEGLRKARCGGNHSEGLSILWEIGSRTPRVDPRRLDHGGLPMENPAGNDGVSAVDCRTNAGDVSSQCESEDSEI